MPNRGKYKKILVGIDSSENASKAFFEAAHIAKRNDAVLYVVHVINNLVGYLTDDAIAQLKDDAQELSSNLMAQAENIGFTNIEVIIQVGSPKQLITHTLPKELGAELIVLGATGKHRLQESLLGSVPHYASTNANRNVLIVRQ
ncbi:universal stress protein [Vagococcus sp. BWB3-3]|uniref:Universal stress protein n=1 Tax=Vagococcus allomyrinae TaxID=2794353 RepID=A0A940SVR2_9ENTE|nr:universal stress protein [Vagococcus allomyrinae]MBP1042149.1 universal stress protein [Vagococcus allomyrinae]